MKTLKFAFLLISFTGLLFFGCSDELQSPVSPDNLPSELLNKSTVRYFESTEGPNLVDYPHPSTIIEYEERLADGKRFLSYTEHTFFNAAFKDGGIDILTGDGILKVNVIVDVITGEGITWGILTLTPTETDVQGGVWKIGWRGNLSISGFTSDPEPQPIFTAPLKWRGHGIGGTIDGMQFFSDDIITQVDPFNWSGGGGSNCYIKIHYH